MLNLFKVHAENTIGIKKLTDADLGAGKSHQTHIGLYSDVLTFLPDHAHAEKGLLIHDINYEFVEVYFDRITNPDGTTRSPKFRLGTSEFSLVNRIRYVVQETPEKEWFLIWFGTDLGKIITVLFTKEDDLFNQLKDYMGDFFLDSMKVLSPKIQQYEEIVLLLQNYIIPILKPDLEMNIKKIQLQRMLDQKGRDLDNIFNLTDFSSYLQQIAIEHLSVFLESKKQKGQIIDFEILPIGANKYANYCKIIMNNKVVRNVLLKISTFEEQQEFNLTLDELLLFQEKGDFGVFSIFNVDEQGCALRICSSLKVVLSYLSRYQINDPLMNCKKVSQIIVDVLIIRVNLSFLKMSKVKILYIE
jgi:hypothetical protein